MYSLETLPLAIEFDTMLNFLTLKIQPQTICHFQ